MPHVVVEYTANVEVDARIPELIRVLNDVLTGYADVSPIGDIRTRALCLDQYRMADGTEDDALIHVAFRIKAGRHKAVTGLICAAILTVMRTHLAGVLVHRYPGLTPELVEFGAHGFHVENNMHARFARTAEPQ